MSFIYDGTGRSGKEQTLYNDLINGEDLKPSLRDRGYYVKIIYVDLPLEMSIQRIKIRALESGRYFDDNFLTLEYVSDIKTNFMKYAINPNVDSAKVINNEHSPIVVSKIKTTG